MPQCSVISLGFVLVQRSSFVVDVVILCPFLWQHQQNSKFLKQFSVGQR